MKQAFVTVFLTASIGAALGLAGCSQPQATKTAHDPAALPVTATPAPTEAPKMTAADHLTKARLSLNKAVGELKEKNYQGAQDLLNTAKTHLTEASALAPAPVKAGIEKASARLAAIKELKAPGTDKTLEGLSTTLAALTATAKGVMTGAAGAAGSLMGKTVDSAKGAAAGAPEATKDAAEKAMPRKP